MSRETFLLLVTNARALLGAQRRGFFRPSIKLFSIGIERVTSVISACAPEALVSRSGAPETNEPPPSGAFLLRQERTNLGVKCK